MRALSPRLLRVLLVLSVALNLAVVGIVAGAALRDPPRPDPDRGPAFGPFDRALTREDRKDLRDAFRRAAPDFRKDWARMQAEMDQLLSALRAEPYDPDLVAGIFARQLDRGTQMMALGQSLMADRLARMTPDERAAFADRLQEGMARPRDRQDH